MLNRKITNRENKSHTSNFSISFDDFLECVKQNHVGIVEALIDEGMDINAVHPLTGEWPLQVAVESENYEMVKLLLDRKVDVNFYDEATDSTALTRCLRRGYLHQSYDIQELLITHPHNAANINQVSPKSGSTPLHYVIQCDFLKTLQLLAKKGVNFSIDPRTKYPPVLYAALYKSTPVFEFLLGVDNSNISEEQYICALHYMIRDRFDEDDNVVLLLTHLEKINVNPCTKHPVTKKTALMYAIELRRIKIVKKLLQNKHSHYFIPTDHDIIPAEIEVACRERVTKFLLVDFLKLKGMEHMASLLIEKMPDVNIIGIIFETGIKIDPKSFERIREYLHICREPTDHFDRAHIQFCDGMVAKHLGNYQSAVKLFEGNRYYETEYLVKFHLGETYSYMGDDENALRCFAGRSLIKSEPVLDRIVAIIQRAYQRSIADDVLLPTLRNLFKFIVESKCDFPITPEQGYFLVTLAQRFAKSFQDPELSSKIVKRFEKLCIRYEDDVLNETILPVAQVRASAVSRLNRLPTDVMAGVGIYFFPRYPEREEIVKDKISTMMDYEYVNPENHVQLGLSRGS